MRSKDEAWRLVEHSSGKLQRRFHLPRGAEPDQVHLSRSRPSSLVDRFVHCMSACMDTITIIGRVTLSSCNKKCL
jgi:hypothetical protein